jgi:hypothetical protein
MKDLLAEALRLVVRELCEERSDFARSGRRHNPALLRRPVHLDGRADVSLEGVL